SLGGISLIGNPQSTFLSPAFFFTSIFGILPGLKLEIVFHSLIGLIGMYLLLRYLMITEIAAMIGAVIFMFNSHFVLHWGVGHMTWLPMAYLPLLVLCHLKS